jgi:SagB-type dehydrogenase family enzyme
MKKFIILMLIARLAVSCSAQNSDTIKLPQPHKQGGKPLMEALNERHSSRNFIPKDLNDQQLSDLLWAAYGINRPGEGKRTVPTANNKQEMDVYIATSKGAFRYNAEKNSLVKIVSDDIRSKTGGQDFVKDAALDLIYVINKDKSGSKDETGKLVCGSVAAGAIAQNVYLYCTSENLGCVVRGYFDKDILSKLLKLENEQLIILTQTVGYLK